MEDTYARHLYLEFCGSELDDSARWARVERAVAEHEAETLWLDFKAVDPKLVSEPKQGNRRSSDDAEDYLETQFARALSAYANTEGGVLIYGISTKDGERKNEPDRAEKIVAIEHVGRLAVELERLAKKHVDPCIAGVVTKAISKPGDGSSGVVIVYVPPSDGGPHRVVAASPKSNERYYLRTNTSCEVMSHATLADRFGRTARPMLRLRIHPRRAMQTQDSGIQLEFRLHNDGRAAAVRAAVQLVDPPLQIDYTSFSNLGTGFTSRGSVTAEGTQRRMLAANDGVLIYPGDEALIGTCNLRRGESASMAGKIGLVFRVVLYALEMQPIQDADELIVNLRQSLEGVVLTLPRQLDE